MIHHPMVLIPKLIFLGIIIVVLIILHGMLEPAQFRVAVIVAGVVFLGFVIGLWIFAAKVLANPDSRVGRATVHSQVAKSEDGFTASPDDFASLVGKKGRAVSNLNPAGTAFVEDQRIPVLTSGEFVEADSPIEVVEAKGSRVVVKGVEE